MGLLSWFFNDHRQKVGWALMDSDGNSYDADSKSSTNSECSCHDWEEISRDGLGWDGGEY